MNSIVEWLVGINSGELAGHDWRVGFVSDHNNYARLALFGLLAAMIWLVIHCYRREGKAYRKMRGFLAVVRIAVVTIVMLILFQPAVIVDITETLYSKVVFLIDDSMSMSFSDRYSDQEQAKVRAALEEKLNCEGDEIEEMSRSSIVVRRLTDSGVVGTLAQDHPVELMKFSTESPAGASGYTAPLGSIGLLEEGATDSNDTKKALAEAMKSLSASGFETDHADALRATLEKFQGRRVGAIVMVGDGRSTRPRAALRLNAAMEYAKQRGVPCYSVLVGDPQPPRNLSILGVRAPREVRAGSIVDFSVLLSGRNIHSVDGNPVVRLYRRKKTDPWPEDLSTLEPVAERVVDLEEGGKERKASDKKDSWDRDVNFQVKTASSEAGEYVYRALVVKVEDEQSDKDK